MLLLFLRNLERTGRIAVARFPEQYPKLSRPLKNAEILVTTTTAAVSVKLRINFLYSVRDRQR